MAKYRKKPIVVEAEQWFPGKSVKGVQAFDDPDSRVRDALMDALVPGVDPADYGILDTFDGIRIVVAGDWIVDSEYGVQSVVKPDLFHDLYEPLDARVQRAWR
jgi:hypothetical protein